ncbi:aldehyde dehydrogenase [Anaerocolumna cellulosilytica]|uniref:Aldehyde dehydrogenase n=1 Tax=Anaerocolumna cellulosilytica TaxID=433286 RepID=A0A6S6RAY4_9FIRM|nr:aldehyde dehydrogenase [Anaerocolumna cellulosilytica]MBB5194951.1 aldehyde dehydrogenase (NAD+) [Anaerocolumna cellulosilytica]BCJ96215.1 aldehyde dehydrogenase [Anaerocolumna cellulosilytica]
MIKDVVTRQREFFQTGKTKSVDFRLKALKRLRYTIIKNEDRIAEALKKDLNKSGFESYMTEIGFVLDEIKNLIKHTPAWAGRKYVRTPLAQFASLSFVQPEPYGVVLVMSPWNYPFQLSIAPLAGAIAAGNCVVVKPSAYTPNVSAIVADIIKQAFPSKYVTVIQGGRQENQKLLEQKFDYIFFTGGGEVGRQVMEKAAKHLTPVSLELGGKSPCIVEKTANLKLAAKRIVFGKFLNAGQTCVAPDYLYVQEEVKDLLISYMKQYILEFFGTNPLKNPDYPKIVNEKHYNRLLGLIEGEKIITGGTGNGNQIVPTLLEGINKESKIMQEEIFGPILPILTFRQLSEVTDYVTGCPKPLALYLFTRSKKVEQEILNKISFGGGCINDTIIHLATPYMGFGGVGESGMGSYHGSHSFDTFSHKKSIVKKAYWIDLPMRYHPYTKAKEAVIRFFLK